MHFSAMEFPLSQLSVHVGAHLKQVQQIANGRVHRSAMDERMENADPRGRPCEAERNQKAKPVAGPCRRPLRQVP